MTPPQGRHRQRRGEITTGVFIVANSHADRRALSRKTANGVEKYSS